MSEKTIWVAIGYWCDETREICAGFIKSEVEAFADKFQEEYPATYNAEGYFVNGIGIEGYWIREVRFLG